MIELHASQPHYLDHLIAATRGLARTAVVTGQTLVERATAAGVSARIGKPNGDGTPVLVADYRDARTVHPSRRVGLVEHGAGQTYVDADHQGYAGGPGWDRLSLVLVPGPHAALRWRSRYPALDVVEIGCPRLDGIGAPEPETIGVTFHWNCQQCPETRPAFREWAGQVRELVLARPGKVLAHWHPKWGNDQTNRLRRWWTRFGDLVELVPDADELLRRAEVLVADNTSLLYEFAALGRPVVCLNATHYRRDVEHGLRFWSHPPGLQLDPGADLTAGVDEARRYSTSIALLRARAVERVYRVEITPALAISRWARG